MAFVVAFVSRVVLTKTVEFPSKVEFVDAVELLLPVAVVLVSVVLVLAGFGSSFGLGGAPQNFLTMS